MHESIAIKIKDGSAEVISEGKWKLFNSGELLTRPKK